MKISGDLSLEIRKGIRVMVHLEDIEFDSASFLSGLQAANNPEFMQQFFELFKQASLKKDISEDDRGLPIK